MAVTNAKNLLAQLEAWGSEGARRIYQLQGAGEHCFGVPLGKLRPLAEKLKRDHGLALELWASGNVDAQVLATMVIDPSRLIPPEAERMLKACTWFRVADELINNAILEMSGLDVLRAKWIKGKHVMVARAGWSLITHQVVHHQAEDLDLDALLKLIESSILRAPLRKQEAMNRTLVEIAVHIPKRTKQCIALGEKLGRFDTRPTPKGCIPTYAPEWIAAALAKKKGA